MTITIGHNFKGKIRLFKILSSSYADNPELVPGLTLDESTYSYCISSKFLDIDASCSDNCNNGRYTNSNSRACLSCSLNCESCSNSTNCNTCSPGYDLYIDSESISSCITPCPDGYISDGVTCISCASNCSTCSNLLECAFCDSGFFLSASSVCVSCSEHCSICTSTGCSACDANYFLSNIAGVAFCAGCLSNCYFCYNSSNCDECFKDFYKVTFENTTDACVETCPDYFYPTEPMICENCLNNCMNCTNDSVCLECGDGYYLHTYTGNSTQICTQECPEYYFGSSNKICENCVTNCTECTDYDNCVTCINHYTPVLQPNGTKICLETQCEFNQYFLDDICYYCFANCSSCTSYEDCSSCGNSTYLMTFSNSSYACIEHCPEYYYYEDSEDMKCKSCISNCKTCLNDSHCSQCNDEYFLYRTDNLTYYACTPSCPSEYYESDENTCEHCLANCFLCINSSSCNECVSNYYLFTSPSLVTQCLDSCPESTFIESNTYCTNCSANCQNCTNLTQCETCKSNYFMLTYSNGTDTCLSVCPDGYYSEDGISCTNCSDACTSCSSWVLCESCENSYFLVSNASNEAYCFDTCFTGNYIDQNNNCLPCPLGCLDCTSASFCLLCNTPSYLPTLYIDGSIFCASDCPMGYYSNGTAYLPCDFRCSSCTNSSNTDCIECDYSQDGVTIISGLCECRSGSSANTETRACESCGDILCTSCNPNNYAECYSCSSTVNWLYLDSSTKTCKCKDGKYRMNENCYSCHSFCKTCTGGTSTQCVASQCADNCYPLASNPTTCLYMCKSEDDTKYFDSSTKQCKNCISPCKSCSEASVCNSCISNFYLYNGECLSHCPDKYFVEDQTCYPCDSKCTSCTKKSTYCVSSCENPYF